MGQKFSDPTSGERAWIAENLASARKLAEDAGVLADTDVVDPEILDATWASWLATGAGADEDPNPVINALGIAFGQYLADRLQLEWTIVEDEHGTDLAVTGSPGDIVIFPANLVAKRYENGEPRFFVSIARQMEDQVGKVRASYGKKGLFGRFRG